MASRDDHDMNAFIDTFRSPAMAKLPAELGSLPYIFDLLQRLGPFTTKSERKGLLDRLFEDMRVRTLRYLPEIEMEHPGATTSMRDLWKSRATQDAPTIVAESASDEGVQGPLTPDSAQSRPPPPRSSAMPGVGNQQQHRRSERLANQRQAQPLRQAGTHRVSKSKSKSMSKRNGKRQAQTRRSAPRYPAKR